MTSPEWPPSKETLEEWARKVETQRGDLRRAIAFLRDPRLQAALTQWAAGQFACAEDSESKQPGGGYCLCADRQAHEDMERRRLFPKIEDARSALDLQRAVEWLHAQERTEFTSKGHAVFCPHGWTPDALWWVRDYRYPGDDPRNWSRAATLPEAVSALRARLEKESDRG